MMVYAASCMFQGPLASQPLIRLTLTGLDGADDLVSSSDEHDPSVGSCFILGNHEQLTSE